MSMLHGPEMVFIVWTRAHSEQEGVMLCRGVHNIYDSREADVKRV